MSRKSNISNGVFYCCPVGFDCSVANGFCRDLRDSFVIFICPTRERISRFRSVYKIDCRTLNSIFRYIVIYRSINIILSGKSNIGNGVFYCFPVGFDSSVTNGFYRDLSDRLVIFIRPTRERISRFGNGGK